MQVTFPWCRALADRTYDPPHFRRTKCPNCGYELEEVRRTGPFNQWKETAWHLWRKGEI